MTDRRRSDRLSLELLRRVMSSRDRDLEHDLTPCGDVFAGEDSTHGASPEELAPCILRRGVEFVHRGTLSRRLWPTADSE